MVRQNIFSDIPANLKQEAFETLLENNHLMLERIISYGHATPAGEWYDQERDEWVLVLQGKATLRFEDGEESLEMNPGDFMLIPAHKRHRVEWTRPDMKTIWLALHYLEDGCGAYSERR